MVTVVINSPYELTGFEYGQETVFDNFQANLLIASIIFSGFVSLLLWPLRKWLQFTISSLTLILIFATFIWIFSRDLDYTGYVTYHVENHKVSNKHFFGSNHSVSIRGELINKGKFNTAIP